MKHPPTTSVEQRLGAIDCDLERAHERGGYTAVLEVAEQHAQRLHRDLADLTDGLAFRYVRACERSEPPSALEIEVDRLRRALRRLGAIADRARDHARKEALGWTVLADGTTAKVTSAGHVLSTISSVRYEEPDGTIVDTAPQPGEPRSQRHRRLAREFGLRARGERLARARTKQRAFAPRTVRPRARARGAGRPRAQSARSSARSGDGGDDGPDHEAPPHVVAFARACAVPVGALRWCGATGCRVVAFAIDDHQRARLDADGFTDGRCPGCAAGGEL